MKFLFYLKIIRRGLISKESAVVLLAFTLTTCAYGFIILSYIPSITPRTQTAPYVVESVFLNYQDGFIWRVVVQLSSRSSVSLNLSSISVRLVSGGELIPIFSSGFTQVVDGRFVLGSLVYSLTSGRVLISEMVGGSVNLRYVDLFAYLDQLGRLNVVIDDDQDNFLDSTYLIRFTSDTPSTYGLDIYGEVVLEVGKGSSLPIKYLDLIALLSVRPNVNIKVVDSVTNYLISLPEILANLRGGVIMAWLSGNDINLDVNERAYITILIPPRKVVEGSRLCVDLVVEGKVLLSKEYDVPKGLTGSGTLVMP